MTNKLPQITTLILVTILIAGGIGLVQFAYSTGYTQNDDDKKQNDGNKKQNEDNKKQNDGNKKQNEDNKNQHEENLKQHDDDCDNENDDENDAEHDNENDDDCKPEGESLPAMITLLKAITNDNGGTKKAEDFHVSIDGVEVIPLGASQSVTPGVSHRITEDSVEGYSFVLIAGDTGCPSKLDEPFKLKGGESITCTIYNEDNFVKVQPGGEGIIFRHNSMQVQLAEPGLWNSCDKYTESTLKDPCIEIIRDDAGRIGIVDSALTSDTTIVLFSVVEANRLETTLGAVNPVCSIKAIVQHDKKSFYLWDQRFDPDTDPEAFPSNPTTHNVVVLECTGMVIGPISDPEDPSQMYSPIYKVNYAYIDPAI